MNEKTYLEKTNPNGSKKFWSIEISGINIRRKWGKVGGNPQTKNETFGYDQQAEAFYTDIVAKKLREGYVRVMNTAGVERSTRYVLYVSKQLPSMAERADVNFSDGDRWLVTKNEAAWYPAQEYRITGDDRLYKWTPTGVTQMTGSSDTIRGFRITKMDEDFIAQADSGWTGEIYDLREGIPRPEPKPNPIIPSEPDILLPQEARANSYLRLIECQCPGLGPNVKRKHLPWCVYSEALWASVERGLMKLLHDAGYARHPYRVDAEEIPTAYEWLDPDCRQVCVDDGGWEGPIPEPVLAHYRENEAW